ncbi:hypothetical protein [Streptomyces cinereoruber]|uniref:DUF4232 domain-containing protein n=1 Tax=Streptomyces cinereoruber TaxID=67260 RepID=A0ABX6BGZ5_9ACTN|nr:hypothetical protein [Streptomyces cinereoruber]MBB4161578.1 hypothetical protein [Streptomyces cinereoruber]MBY8818646.1 hypothetical protein [Streptomyces cinereoruber]NIH60874.1 hypothetical protein [Streptomyces cinereoruber]QEV33396.1 hypothetical protein CP977_15480 [Streptomyces cinereoruber]
MGSLRNPVGPLPSTIYWRRRAVALCLIALLALLTVWAVTSGGGGGEKPNDSANGSSPTPPSITPGPSGSGPAISQQPGGRDESDEEDGASGGNGGAEPGGSGSDSGSGSGGTDAGTGSGGADSAGPGVPDGNGDGSGDGGAGTGAGRQLPADSPIPNCPAGAVQLTLKSVKVTYETGEKPRFQLVAKNTSATDCKADFGPRSAVLTISDAKDDEVWSSAHCPRPGTPLLLSLPAGATVTHTVEWDRGRSAPQCATAPAGRAGPGTYLVEAAMPGVKILPASFTLAKD